MIGNSWYIIVVVFVFVDSRNLPLKFGQNRDSNSFDIAEIEFPVVVIVVVGGCVKSFSCQTQLYYVRLSWACGIKNLKINQSNPLGSIWIDCNWFWQCGLPSFNFRTVYASRLVKVFCDCKPPLEVETLQPRYQVDTRLGLQCWTPLRSYPLSLILPYPLPLLEKRNDRSLYLFFDLSRLSLFSRFQPNKCTLFKRKTKNQKVHNSKCRLFPDKGGWSGFLCFSQIWMTEIWPWFDDIWVRYW